MKKIIIKIGTWILGIGGAESINEMSSRLKKFASKHKQNYTCVKVEKYSNHTEYSVYMNGSNWHDGKTFYEAFKKLQESYLKKDVKQIDTLI